MNLPKWVGDLMLKEQPNWTPTECGKVANALAVAIEALEYSVFCDETSIRDERCKSCHDKAKYALAEIERMGDK